MKNILELLGRVLLSFIFLYEAYDYIVFFRANKAVLTSYGIDNNQNLLIVGAIFLLVLGGLLLLTGYRSRFGAVLLLLYWIPVTFVVHSFWNDPAEVQRLQSTMFMKNMAIAGGLLLAVANESGRHSIRRLFATYRVPDA